VNTARDLRPGERTCLRCGHEVPATDCARLLVVDVDVARTVGADVYACIRCLAEWHAQRVCPVCGAVGRLYFDHDGETCVGCDGCVTDA
jgi:hypothetical protein